MHVSLDSALGRQRRLNSVGETISSIAPLAAAYSLRSLTGGDPKVVRVRRGSDNAEQDFTASGISSGALVDFVNEDVTIYQSDFSAGLDGFSSAGTTTATGNQDGVSDSAGTSKDNVLKVVKASDSQGYLQRDNGVVAGLTYTVSGSFFAPSANTSVDGIMIKDGLAGSSLSNYPSGYLTSDGTWTDFSFSYTATSSGNQRVQLGVSSLGSNPNGSSSGSTGDIVYIADLKFVETISNGFVETWYDQSGNSNDAVQATAGSQPKIVNAGSLIADGIDFDGSDDTLTAASVSGFGSTISIFEASIRDSGGAAVVSMGSSAATGNTNFGIIEGSSISNVNARNTTSVTASASVSGATRLTFGLTTGQTSTKSGALGGTLSENTSDYGSDFTSGELDTIFLGKLRSGSGTSFNGHIKEALLYATDQSSNRDAIEANIANHYNITLV